MRRIVSILGAVIVAGGLTGCASSGVRVSDQQVAAFHPGQTTYAQVVAALGEPTTLTDRSDGSKVAVYTYTHAHPKAASFIPVVGWFAGGTDVHSRSVAFSFDKNGVLQKHAISTGNSSAMLGEPVSAAPGTNTQQ